MNKARIGADRMMEKIRSQADSLAGVLEHHCGEGQAALMHAASLIRTARQVVITGMGASYFGSLPLEAHLCSLGINAVAVEAGEFLHFRPKAYRAAVVIAVSRSGESIEIAKLLAILKGAQPVIGVCNRPESLLAREADVTISVNSMNDDIVALQTYTGTVLTLYLLAKSVERTLMAAKEATTALLPRFAELVDSCARSIDDWERFLPQGSNLYLLARGASCASALEGALLFNEVSKTPAVAMATASFRHGPVEVVDERFRSLVFAPKGPTQRLNLALASDVVRFGGQVRIIGSQVLGIGGLPAIELPEVPETLAPLFEIVPIQVAALKLALLRGIIPGSFRFAPPVALDEEVFVHGQPAC